jgi:hypothetical protein
MSTQTRPAARPWHRRLRFSIRALVIFVLLIGGGLGWLVRSVRIQREAVATIKRLNGYVLYDWQWKNGRTIESGEPWAPGWLVDTFGVDYFGNVAKADLPPGACDDDLIKVGRLGQLQDLSVSSPRITDAGLAHLQGLTNLSALVLNGTQISDAGLPNLKGLTRLTFLDLDNTRVSDAGLPHLKRLTRLSLLGLWGTQVTDAGVKELNQAIPSLTIVQ